MGDSEKKNKTEVVTWIFSGIGTTVASSLFRYISTKNVDFKWIGISVFLGIVVCFFMIFRTMVKTKKRLESEVETFKNKMNQLNEEKQSIEKENIILQDQVNQMSDEQQLIDDEIARLEKLNMAYDASFGYYNDIIFLEPSDCKLVLNKVLVRIQEIISSSIGGKHKLNVSLFTKIEGKEEFIIQESTKHTESTKKNRKLEQNSMVFAVYNSKKPDMSDDIKTNTPNGFREEISNKGVKFNSIICIPIFSKEEECFCGVLCITADVPIVEIYNNNIDVFNVLIYVIEVLKRKKIY